LEAAVKYFFAGAFAGALFLLGMALFYAETGRLGFVAGPLGPQAQAGAALMAAAALFKIGAVPLHWWLPDVYESADPELAGFLSTSMKAAAVLMLVRLVQFAPGAFFARALPAIGATTAMVGAALSLRQRGLRRLLAYSSLSHAGFMIMAVGAWAALGRDRAAAAAILFYVAAYAVLGNGAYSFVKAAGAETRASMRGFASRRPALAAAFAVILFSLAGIPPTGGFFAKLLVFWQLLRADAPLTAGVAAVSALISLVVYLGLVRDLYFEPLPQESSTLVPSGAAALVCGATALAALALGAAPALLTGPVGVFWR
jgi:NADH-quinone oxidoreductase subunit N